MMTIKSLRNFAILLLIACTQFACGGGGGGGGGPAPSATTVSGVASKGIIANGTVTIYGLKADGSKTASALATAKTDANGAYSASIGSYSGPIIVEAYGSYTDEATGVTVKIPSTSPLQAALPASRVTGTVSLPVTPLTDIAVRMAQNSLTGTLTDNIAAANDAVSRLFGVDIVATLPAKPDASVLQSASTTDSQRKYTALLAVVSQYVANACATPGKPTSDDLTSVLARISGGITQSGSASPQVEPSVASALQSAVAAFSNNTSVSAKAIKGAGSAVTNYIASIETVGSSSGNRIVAYTLKTTSNSSYSGQVGAIYANIELTDTISLPNGEVSSATLVASGAAAVSSNAKSLTGNVAGGVLSVALMDAGGISLGEFATIYFEVPAGTTPPSSLTVNTSYAKKTNAIGDAISISGVSVAVTLSSL